MTALLLTISAAVSLGAAMTFYSLGMTVFADRHQLASRWKLAGWVLLGISVVALVLGFVYAR